MMLLDYNFKKYNIRLVLYVLMLNLLGIMVIRSATNQDMTYVGKQVMGIIVGFSIVLFLSLLDYHRILALGMLTYTVCAGSLVAVILFGERVNNATRWLKLPGIGQIQPSEFVKIIYVFFLAGMLTKDITFRHVAITTVAAAAHVLILVVSKDLGTAVVFFTAYLVLVYVATKNPVYPLAGLSGGALASVGAYYLFSHGRVRVQAWQDPFYDYKVGGYQIAQALFAICAGGWFGTGLFEGSPTAIPVATQDFAFAAICEELGGIFAICVILVCMSCFLMIVNISMRLSKKFYKLIALGLGAEYAIQVFLTVGGNIKFIPMTGITVPLVSYGGSSMICSIMMFAIIQGLYILRDDEHEQREQEKAQSVRRRNDAVRKTRGYSLNEEEKSLEEKITEQTEKSLNW